MGIYTPTKVVCMKITAQDSRDQVCELLCCERLNTRGRVTCLVTYD
jgi:hypothetical protein